MNRIIFVLFIASLILVPTVGPRVWAQPSPSPQPSKPPSFEPQEEPRPNASVTSGAHALSLSCNKYNRWPIKTLSDANASLVNQTPRDITIAALRAMPAPSPHPLPSEYPSRIGQVELTTYRLSNVTLSEIHPPGSDKDYHLVVQDSAGHQFITESVNPACASGSIVISQIQEVRAYIDGHFTVGSTVINPNVPVTVTGVGFYDPYTGGEHAPNGLELHPLMSIVVASAPSPAPSAYYAGPNPAPTTLFYSHSGQSGAVSVEMDPRAAGASTTKTLTYQASPNNSSWGWVSGVDKPGVTAWPAATYIVKLDIAQPNAALQIKEVKIYRVDSNGGPQYVGLAVVGDLTSLSQSLAHAGIVTFAVPGIAQSTSASDRLAVKFYITNISTATQSFSYAIGASTASQIVVQPTSTP